MANIDRYEILYAKTKAEFPRFNVKERNKSWLGPIFKLLSKITRQSYDGFTTTVFSTMYVGPTWASKSPNGRYKLLRHEKKHIEQSHCWPLGRWAWPINHLLHGLAYLLLLPVIWTLRSKFEREGYTQTMLVDFELNGRLSETEMEQNATWMADTFGGSTYFFMWRRAATYAWAMDTQRKINNGEITNPADRVDDQRVAVASPSTP